MAWESHHNIHCLRAAPDVVKPLPSTQLHIYFYFFYRLNYHDRHDMNSWMEMHLPSSLYIHTLLDERSVRSLESVATSSWQKKKWKHHNHKENSKQTKIWKVTPEEDENDDTFTGWVSSCENSTSAIYGWPLSISALALKYHSNNSWFCFWFGRWQHYDRFTLLLFITRGHSQLARASICHDPHLPLLYLVLRLINWFICV